MLNNSSAGGRCPQKLISVDGHYNVLNGEDPSTSLELLQPEKSGSDKNNTLSLADYDANYTSTRNFYLVSNTIPSEQLCKNNQKNEDDLGVTTSTLNSDEKLESDLDTVCSGESLIKHFNFDTSKYNGDTNKCIAFWRTLMKTDLQPVKCTLIKGGKSNDTVVQEEENSESDSLMWYKALVELQRRKMDELALAASCQQCGLCGREEPYAKFKKKQGQHYTKDELRDNEDITQLNYWNPNKPQPKLVDASTNVQHSESFTEESLSTTNKKYLAQLAEDNKMPNDEQNVIKSRDHNGCKFDCGASPIEGVIEELDAKSPDNCEEKDIQLETMDNVEQGKCVLSRSTDRELETPLDVNENCICVKADDCDATTTNKEQLLTENIATEILLGECNICENECKCWEKKIAMSKQFINHARSQFSNKQANNDKSCATEVEKENCKEKKLFCIICGHDDCNCCGPQYKPRHNYLEYIQFDDDVVTSLITENDIDSKIESHNNLKTSQQRIDERNIQHTNANIKTSCILPTITKMTEQSYHNQKKFFITPEQRAKAIINTNAVTLQPDKYGVPQIVRYANGQLGLKPKTSADILSDSNEN